MRMELIQPFINAADAVLAETLNCSTRMGDVAMEVEVYRRKGVAAIVVIHGDIEGRVIFDLDSQTAVNVASALAGTQVSESESVVCETVCELANLVIGNAVTTLNDQGFRFKIAPPEIHSADAGSIGFYACNYNRVEGFGQIEPSQKIVAFAGSVKQCGMTIS